MKSFKQYLIESNADVDTEIKNKLADEAEASLKNSDEWNSMSQSERDAAIKDARKKAEDKYNNLSEEEKQKKRDAHKASKEPTDEELDKEIKDKLADDAEKKLAEGEFWNNKTDAEKEAAVKDARKKAEEDYDKLSDEDKAKKRDEHKATKNKPAEPSNDDIDKEIKKDLANKAEEEVKKQEGWDDQSEEYKKKAIDDARKKAEDDYDKLSDEDKAKKRDEHKATKNKSAEPQKNGEPNPKPTEPKPTEPKAKTDKDGNGVKKFLGMLMDIDDTISSKDKSGNGVYNTVKSMAPDVLQVVALCCPVAALAGLGALALGGIIAMTVSACKKNGNDEMGKKVAEEAVKSAKENGNEDIQKQANDINKSVTGKDGKLLSEEEINKNLEKNGMGDVVKTVQEQEKKGFFEKIKEKFANITKKTKEEEPVEKTEDELKQELKDKYKDAENIPDNLKGEDGKLDPSKIDELSGDDLKNATKEAGIEATKKTEPKEPVEKTEDELKQELKDKYKDAKDIPDNLKGDDGKLDPNKIDALSGDDLKNTTKNAGIEATKKTEPKEPAKSTKSAEPKELSNEDIEKMQDEMANLDPEKDKDKIKEMEDQLKDAAKKAGKDESEYLMKTDTDKDGKQRQRKTGPRGGKYYRVKGDDGWGDWISGEPNESLTVFLQNNINIINENKSNNMKLSEYLHESLNDDARELFIKVISEEWDENLYKKLSKKIEAFKPNNQQLFSFMKGLHTLVKKRIVKENLNLNWIDTSNITSMYMMFKGKKVMFDMTKWNTSNVTNFTECFADAQIYKNTIENWDMSSADALPYMFADATVNCDLSKWIVGKTNYLRYINIFKNCKIDKKHYPMMKDVDGSIQQMNEYFGLD